MKQSRAVFLSFLLKYLKKKKTINIAKSSKFNVKVILMPVSFNLKKKEKKKCIHSKYIEIRRQKTIAWINKHIYKCLKTSILSQFLHIIPSSNIQLWVGKVLCRRE